MVHKEDSRVKIPSILHLTRLGYDYLSLKGCDWDESTNILSESGLSMAADGSMVMVDSHLFSYICKPIG